LADTEKKCNIYGNKFKNSFKLNQHKKESHQTSKGKPSRPVTMYSRYKATGITAVTAVTILSALDEIVLVSGNVPQYILSSYEFGGL
jgi:hypothetical protein